MVRALETVPSDIFGEWEATLEWLIALVRWGSPRSEGGCSGVCDVSLDGDNLSLAVALEGCVFAAAFQLFYGVSD